MRTEKLMFLDGCGVARHAREDAEELKKKGYEVMGIHMSDRRDETKGELMGEGFFYFYTIVYKKKGVKP